MGIAPISGQPSQPLGPAPMVGSAPMGPPPPMMGGMPPPPMMAPPPMAPPIAPITEGLGGFGGSSAGRAGFSERMQRMTSPPKPRPMPQSSMNGGMHQMPDGSMMLNSDMPQPIQRMSYGGMVGSGIEAAQEAASTQAQRLGPLGMPYGPKIAEQYQPYQNFGMPQQGSANALNQYGDYLDNQYGDPQFEQKRDNFLQGIAQQEQQTFGGMGGFNTPQPAITERPGPQRNLGDSEYLSGIFGSQAGDYQDLANYQVARPMANGGSVSSDPVKMALGGFIGNPTTRDYSDDDPFGTDDLLDSLGIPDFNPNKDFGGGGDDSGGDDDDYYNYLDDNYVYTPPPAPAPPVVVPEPEPESGGDDIKNMILAEAAKQVAGANNDIQLSDGTVLSESDLKPVVGTSGSVENLENISSLVSDLNAQLGNTGSIDAVGAAPVVGSGDAGPEIFADVPNILGQNPISLLSPLAPSPISVNERLTPGGGIVPSGSIDIGGSYVPPRVNKAVSSPDFAQPELLNENQTEAFFNRDTRRPDMLNIALPGGSSKTRIEDAGLANAMAAAQGVDASEAAAINALGSDAYTGVFEPEFVEPTPAEVMASNRRAMAEARADDAALAREGSLGGADAAIDGGYQPNLRRGPFGPIGPESSFPGDGRVDSLALPADTVFPEAEPEQIGGGLAGASTRPGMGSDDPIVYNDTPSGPVFTRPDGTVLTQDDSAAINAQARLDANPPTGFDTMALEEAAYPKGNIVDETFPQSPGDIFSTPSTDGSFQFSGLSDPLNGVTTDVSRIADDMRRVIGEDIQNPPKTLRQATGRAPMTSEEAAMNVSGIDSAGNVVSLAGASGYDSPAAAANRANALAQPATADPDGGGTDIFDSYAALTRSMKAPNKGETNLIRNAMAGARHTEDGPGYKKGDLVVEDRFADKVLSGFETALSFLLPGPMDFKAMSQENRNKALQAYYDTGKIVYEEGKPVGFEDKEGGLVRLVPKEQDDTGGDDDGCPSGFRRVNGVCMPIQRVAANPATAIEDAIASATLPSTLRPVVRDVVDDDDEEETSDVGGLTIRRPNYFAGGGAVSDGMGSAIDSFISAMGGSVKKKSNVAPVGMARGGYVDMQTESGSTVKDGFGNPVRTRVSTPSMSDSEKDERNFSYDPFPDDVYGRGGRGVDNDPVAPAYNFYADAAAAPVYPDIMSSGFFNPEPEPDNIVQRSLRPQLRPASFDPYVNNAISSVQDNYNDGSVGPTMQNAAALPKQETFMQGISNYLPASVNSAFMLGPNYDQSVFGAAGEMGGELATSFYDDVIGPEGKPLEYLGGAAVDLGRSVFDTLYDPPKAVYGAVDSVFDAFGRLGTETNARDRVGNIIGGPLAAATAVTPLGRLGKLTPKNNTISTDIKPSNETLTFYKGSPVAYDPEPGFPLGRDRSDYSGTGEGNRPMGSPEALGEAGVPSGKAYGAGAYQSMSPSTATGYRFMRSGLDRDLSAAAMKAAQERVDFADAGGRPDNFKTFFSEKIDDVDNAVKDASLGVKSAEDVYADANRTAAERILDSSIFDTSRFRGDPRREIDPQGFYRSVVFGANDQIDEELYAIRDMISNRGNMDYGNPGYRKRMEEINRDFPNLTNLTNKQIAERRAELRDLSKQYTGDVSKKYIDLTQTYRIAQDAEKAKKNLTDFKTAVTGDLPGVLYKTQIQEGKLGSSFEYGNPADNQILTQATNALGVDAMNAKLFGTGPDAKKLQYNPKTQQYSLPLGARGQKVTLDERMLAPKTVAEAELYYKGGITHGQHTDRAGVTNKIFFSDPVTPVPVGRYNRGGQVGMGLGSL